jgi:predicted HAD superfamily phosphohydrolase YqeG
MTSIETHDYRNTLRQFFGSFGTFKRNISPAHLLADYYAESLEMVTPYLLKSLGINTLLWDVDGTLMRYHGLCIDDCAKDAFEKLTQPLSFLNPSHEWFNNIILSNSGENRYRDLSRIFPNIPNFRMYQNIENPEDVLHRVIFFGHDTFFRPVNADIDTGVSAEVPINGIASGHSGSQHETRVRDIVLDYVICEQREVARREKELPDFLKDYVVIKKPDPRLIKGALQWYNVDPAKALMIGDRHSTDISGAKQAGIRAIRITPMYPESDPFLPRLGRFLESALVGLYHLKYEHRELTK